MRPKLLFFIILQLNLLNCLEFFGITLFSYSMTHQIRNRRKCIAPDYRNYLFIVSTVKQPGLLNFFPYCSAENNP